MTRVLVTGGAGLIGSHLCDELLAHGYTVRVLDALDPQVHGHEAGDYFLRGNAEPHPPAYLDDRVDFRYGDVCSQTDVREALYEVDMVVHLAARVGVGQSAYQLTRYVLMNTFGTAVLLEEMGKLLISKLVVASSMSIYGEGQRATRFGCDEPVVEGEDWWPVETFEEHPASLESVYALTKYDQERLALLYGQIHGVPTVALRFFNVYGPRQSLSNPYTGAIAIFAARLLNNQPPIIYEDGQQRRDFVYVTDVARAVRLALESDVTDEVINIGSGVSYSVLELAERLATALGVDIAPTITGQHRVGDIRHCFAGIAKAQRLLGYEPQVTLEQGLALLVPWLRVHQHQAAVSSVTGSDAHGELVERGLLR